MCCMRIEFRAFLQRLMQGFYAHDETLDAFHRILLDILQTLHFKLGAIMPRAQ
jgi:hypothetical protein